MSMTRSTSELFAAAVDWTQDDGEGDWSAVSALQLLGTRDVLEQALLLTTHKDARARARGADILGQLGSPARSFPEECLAAALRLATHDTDVGVLRAAAVALGHLNDARGVGALVALADHEDQDVRCAVALALGNRAEPDAIATLIQLTHDPAAMVRDWATFGLGRTDRIDAPEIREALCERLSDADETTRMEAMCGLARCGDLRAGPAILEALKRSPENAELQIPAMDLLKMDRDGEPTVAELIAGIESLLGRQN